ncbi:MAG: tripartite tricarboxylate transporter substrate-binding protein [Pseudorhodoplanes sp.]|uniref:tripartite tricarboxylate transporter substrate-binding protein n=1 Tax=Pseudorhodoplanes sp. TaxID=1934341 RepID=UPI003D10DA03
MEQVSRQVGQPIVIENRAGGGNTIGMGVVARADPDGYTLLVNSSTHTVTTAIRSSLPFDTLADFTAIVPLASLPLVLVTTPGKGYKSVADLVAYAKANRGKINYASAGAGNQSHLTAEMFRAASDFEAVHLPLKGSPEAVTEVLTGRADFYLCPITSALPMIQSGQLQGLAVTGAERLSALPDVPTFSELGFGNRIYGSWIGVFAPSKTPTPIKERLYAEISKALVDPVVAKKLADAGTGRMPLTSAQFEQLVRDEIEAYSAVAKAANIRVN